MKYLYLFLFLFPVVAAAENLPDCSIQAERSVKFSNNAVNDKLKVNIIGSPCYQAKLNLSITNQAGIIIYKYIADFKPHIAAPWDHPKIDQKAKILAQTMTQLDTFKSSKSLPEWMPKEQYYENYYEEIEIPKNYYSMIRKKEWVIFRHLNHYEGWLVILFDKNKNEAMQIASGGF